jgi:hypothetical protein
MTHSMTIVDHGIPVARANDAEVLEGTLRVLDSEEFIFRRLMRYVLPRWSILWVTLVLSLCWSIGSHGRQQMQAWAASPAQNTKA